MALTLSEKILDAVGNGEDPAELQGLASATALTAAELAFLSSAAATNAGTGKAVITGTSGAVTLVTPTVTGTTTLAGLVQPVVAIADATPYTVLLANSGKRHKILEQTASITVNLPAVTTAGQIYRFEMGGVATEAQNYVFTAAAGAFLTGGVAFIDNDAGAGADEMHAGVYGNGSSHLTLTVTTPAAGTWVEFISNGTIWYVNGWINSATVPAFS